MSPLTALQCAAVARFTGWGAGTVAAAGESQLIAAILDAAPERGIYLQLQVGPSKYGPCAMVGNDLDSEGDPLVLPGWQRAYGDDQATPLLALVEAIRKLPGYE